MDFIKNYNNYNNQLSEKFIQNELKILNEKTLNEGVKINIFFDIIFTIVKVLLIFPEILIRYIYFKLKKNLKHGINLLETSMDVLWTYSNLINEIEDSNIQLEDNHKKIIKKIKKSIKKNFNKDKNLTKDEIKKYFTKKLKKCVKKNEIEYFEEILNNYEIKEISVVNKNIIILKNAIKKLNSDIDINGIDPFDEENWDDNYNDSYDKYMNKNYYIVDLMDNCYIEKINLHKQTDTNFYLSTYKKISIKKEYFHYFLNKYVTKTNIIPNRVYNYVKTDNDFTKNLTVKTIIDEDNKNLLKKIIDDNLDYIKNGILYNYKNSVYFNHIFMNYLFINNIEIKNINSDILIHYLDTTTLGLDNGIQFRIKH
jgi:hypothetical protein